MVTRVFYNKLRSITPRTTTHKLNYRGLDAFLRLDHHSEQKDYTRKEALLPGQDMRPVMVEVNTLSAGELRNGFLEWRKAGGNILANPLDRSQFRDFDEFTPEETLERLENFANRTHVVQSYPSGAFEAYGIFNKNTHVFLMENAPWNNPQINAARSKKLYGTATLIWEVLFENALLEKPRLWGAQELPFFGRGVVSDETWHRLTIMCLRTPRHRTYQPEHKYPNGTEVMNALVHLKVFRAMIFEANPSLAKLAEKTQLPEELLLPFLVQIRDYYQMLERLGYRSLR